MAALSTLARPYARAVFACARKGDLADWSRQLALMVAVIEHPKLVCLLSIPGLTPAQQADSVITVCGDQLSAPAQRLLTLLAENKRLRLLPTIAAAYEQHRAQREQRVTVRLTTAFTLDATVQQPLVDALSKNLQCDVLLETHIDPHLLGGVLIQAGNSLIDCSVRGRLAKLSTALVSTHTD